MAALSGSVLRSRRFVVGAAIGGQFWKIFQVQFPPDGSIFVHFYFHNPSGIAACATIRPGHGEQTLRLEDTGKVTSQLVKYTHHPDGRAHFSQDGKVITQIKKGAVRLRDIDGHLFTVHAEGFHGFGLPKPGEANDGLPSPKRMRLSFVLEPSQEAIKCVANLHSLRSIAGRVPSGRLKPRMQTLLPNGRVEAWAFVCMPPTDSPLADRVLLLSCVGRPRFNPDPQSSSLLFLGGFDAASTALDPSLPTTLLVLQYPLEDAEGVRRRIGSMDYVPAGLA